MSGNHTARQSLISVCGVARPLQFILELFFVECWLGDNVTLCRPVSQVLHAAAFAAKRKIRIFSGLNRRFANGASEFHSEFEIEQRIASGQNTQRRAG